MVSNEEESLWTGTISEKGKKQEKKALSYGFLMGLFWVIVFFLLIIGYDLILMIPIPIILLVIILLGAIPMFWKHLFNKFPEYRLTSEALICKEWTHFGRKRIRAMKLSDLQQIYIEKEMPDEKNDMYFSTKKFDDWAEYPYFKIDESIFRFRHVNSPEKLITALQSLIPFKKHPTLEDTYQRIE